MTGSESGTKSAPMSLGIALALCSVPSVMSAVVLVPILPELFRIFGGVGDANFWIPALVTIPGLCTALLSPVAGYIGDRIGLKLPIVISLVLFSLFGLAPFFLNQFELILASRVALGVSQVGALVLSIALIGQQFEGAARDRWLAIQTIAATSSALVLLPLSGLLANSALGWHGSFLIFLSGIILAVVIARTPVRPTPRHDANHHAGSGGLPWVWLLGQCAVTLLVGVLFFTTQFQFGLALAQVGVTNPGQIGLFSGLAAAGIMLGSACFIAAKKRLGPLLLPTELLVCGVTLVLMRQFASLTPLLILAFINMFACGLMLPTLVTTVAARLPDAVRGRGLGFWNSSFTFGQFLSAAFVGAVLSRSGTDILDAFALLGIGALIMAPIGFGLVALRRRKPTAAA